MNSMPRQSFKISSVCAKIALSISCSQKRIEEGSATASRPFTPPAQPYKFDAEDGQWPMPAKNYSSTRFSGLSEINTTALFMRAFRPATLNELYRSFRVGDVITLANVNLRAERQTGGEGGVRFYLSTSDLIRASRCFGLRSRDR